LTIAENVDVVARAEKLAVVEIFNVDVTIGVYRDSSSMRLVEIIVFTNGLACKLHETEVKLYRPQGKPVQIITPEVQPLNNRI
jgi:hypothetical protein